jgi:hypothetical protein
MTMPEFAPQIHPISRKEMRTIFVDCRGNLDGSAVILGTPDVSEMGTSHLDIANVQVSTTTLTINDQSVPAGKAILFTVDARGAAVKMDWEYRITLEFDADTGDRIAGGIRLETD